MADKTDTATRHRTGDRPLNLLPTTADRKIKFDNVSQVITR